MAVGDTGTGAAPMLVSVTRLRLRSPRFLLPFIYRSSQASRQAQAAAGCLRVRTRRTRGLTFWTLTLWDSEASLRHFLAAAPHRRIMPLLSRWCDEAAVAHWACGTAQPPGWDEATQVLQRAGRLSRVLHPSESQHSGRIEIS